MDEAYKVISHFARKLFKDWSGSLCLFDPTRNNLRQDLGWGETSKAEAGFAPNDCWALRRGRPHYVDVTSEDLICPHLQENFSGESLCIPLTAHGETIGLLSLLKTGTDSISEMERQLSQSVAEHIALIVANLQLREVLLDQAVRDPLTGLFNRRYMEESLEREFYRAVRREENFSVMMLDLDHFKNFNDTFGHEAGDYVLRTLGHIIQETIRAEDIACRFGGEEFALILPGAALGDVTNRAEAILAVIRQAELRLEGRLLGHMSASIGVASFPQHGATPEALLRAADTALYEAKHTGRDRVVVAKLKPETLTSETS